MKKFFTILAILCASLCRLAHFRTKRCVRKLQSLSDGRFLNTFRLKLEFL